MNSIRPDRSSVSSWYVIPCRGDSRFRSLGRTTTRSGAADGANSLPIVTFNAVAAPSASPAWVEPISFELAQRAHGDAGLHRHLPQGEAPAKPRFSDTRADTDLRSHGSARIYSVPLNLSTAAVLP